MNLKLKLKKSQLMNPNGFTLIEVLIVVMVLGILAMLIIPQVTVSTDDAKTSTLQTNLSTLRNAIELYYHQHNNRYPGQTDNSGGAPADAAAAQIAFLQQLTQFTEVDGTVATAKSPTAKYGPYIKSSTLPANPYNDLALVLCDIAETNITTKASSDTTTYGWKFYTQTGVLIANDGSHDSL